MISSVPEYREVPVEWLCGGEVIKVAWDAVFLVPDGWICPNCGDWIGIAGNEFHGITFRDNRRVYIK